MTFGEYYNNYAKGINSSLEEQLKQIHDNAIAQLANSRTQSDCNRLRDFFNTVFYPEKYAKGEELASQYSKKIWEMIQALYEKKYNTIVSNANMGSSDVTYGSTSLEEAGKIIRDKWDQTTHTARIYLQTLKDRREKALQAVENFTGSDQKLKQDLEAFAKSIEEFLGTIVGQENSKGFIKLTDSDLKKSIDELDAAYRNVSTIGGVFNHNDYGDILEWVLQAFNYQQELLEGTITNNIITGAEDDIKKIIETQGSKRIGSNSKDFIHISKADVSSKIGNGIVQTEQVQSESEKNKTTKFTLTGNGNTLSFNASSQFNPNSDRQGKIDVELKMDFDGQDKASPFRISAKNWDNLDRDFGSTPLAYALLRTVDNEATEKYLYVLQDKKKSPVTAHKLAKYAVILDILMGYSQKNNYADTLFINVRSEQKVIVISIKALLDKIYKNIANINISNYNQNAIKNDLCTIRTIISSYKLNKGNSEAYRNLALKYLQSIKTSVTYANISGYINELNSIST